MKKTLVLDDEHRVKGVVLECKATEYMVIDRALSLFAVNQNVPMPQCIYNIHRQCTVPSDSWEASHCRCRYWNGCLEEEEEKEEN